jgi:molecular chaperone HscB
VFQVGLASLSAMQGTLRHLRSLRQISGIAARAPVSRQGGICDAARVFCQYQSRSTFTKLSSQRPLSSRRLASTTTSSSSATGRNIKDDNENRNSDLIANPPDITNYFTIFPESIPRGPPPGSPFEIPLPALRREYLKLQALLHPDKYPLGPTKQRAEALSARINEAYHTLADPLWRAQYLLAQWHGIDVNAEDTAGQHSPDPETLMTVMEVQETIAEVGAARDAEATVDRLKEENAARVQLSVKVLAQAFDQKNIEAAHQECMRLRFWYTVRDALQDWELGETEVRVIH